MTKESLLYKTWTLRPSFQISILQMVKRNTSLIVLRIFTLLLNVTLLRCFSRSQKKKYNCVNKPFSQKKDGCQICVNNSLANQPIGGLPPFGLIWRNKLQVVTCKFPKIYKCSWLIYKCICKWNYKFQVYKRRSVLISVLILSNSRF